MLGLVRHAGPCLRLSRIIKQRYLWEVLNYFVYLLHLVRHPWKLQCYYVVLFGYGLVCPKFSETTNHQYPWKELRDFVDCSQVVICILLNIHGSYKSMLFWAGIVGHSLPQPIRLSDVLNLKKLEDDMRYRSWFFDQSVCSTFFFWLV